MPIHVSLACNDPDNGVFTGRVTSVEIALGPMDVLMKLDDPYLNGRGLALAYLEGRGRFHVGESESRIRVAGREFPVLHRQYGVGNWCWDMVWMRGTWIPPLVELLRKHKWHVDEAEEALFNAYGAGLPIAPVWNLVLHRPAEAAS